MEISDILARERVLCNANLSSKKAVLETLSGLIAGGDTSMTEQDVFNSLLSRERLGGTGLGNGIALPHGRLKNSFSTTAAFIKLTRGVDYDASDRKPVDLIFGLLVPEHSTDEHLRTLAQLAEMFDGPDFLEQLRRAKSSETIYQLLTDDNRC